MHIRLSRYTTALLKKLKELQHKPLPDEVSRISVSPTVSFIALAYEKIRNAVEYREGHLIRKGAIERILKRRLSLNPEGRGEAENLIRELLWARYFPNESLGADDVAKVQDIIATYLILKHALHPKYSPFLFDLATCDIEETLSPKEAEQNALFTFYIYQVLKDKVKIDRVTEDQKNIAFYVALEKAYSKSDISYLRFHLFTLSHKRISQLSKEETQSLILRFPEIATEIDSVIANPYSERIRRFIQTQLPPFNILFEVVRKNENKNLDALFTNREALWQEVERTCKQKYVQTREKLQSLGIKAIVYIFLTKMIFALLLEYPLSLFFYNEVNYATLTVNTLFPPFLMFAIIALTKIPGEQNTKRMFERFVEIIDADRSFETKISFILRKPKVRRPFLIFFFTILYSLTFIITFSLLYEILTLLQFNLVSQAVFVFFVSLVAFFGYRVIQVAKEYRLRERESFFRPFADFFSMPILALGKVLSTGLAKINFLTVLFDFFIEAPFKMIIDVFEEWISFLRSKREEIV